MKYEPILPALLLNSLTVLAPNGAFDMFGFYVQFAWFLNFVMLYWSKYVIARMPFKCMSFFVMVVFLYQLESENLWKFLELK